MTAPRPKPPLSALEIFIKELIQEHERIHHNTDQIDSEMFHKTGREMWTNFSTHVKTHYEKLAIDDRARYEKEIVESVSPSVSTLKNKANNSTHGLTSPGIKKPANVYMLFCEEVRPKLREENPNITIGEMSKLISTKWQECDKEVYNKKYQDEYGPSSAKKRKRDPNAPKKPMTAYLFYCDEIRSTLRAEHPEMSFGELSKHIGKLWETCPEKSKYEEMAREAKEKYNENLNASQTQ